MLINLKVDDRAAKARVAVRVTARSPRLTLWPGAIRVHRLDWDRPVEDVVRDVEARVVQAESLPGAGVAFTGEDMVHAEAAAHDACQLPHEHVHAPGAVCAYCIGVGSGVSHTLVGRGTRDFAVALRP